MFFKEERKVGNETSAPEQSTLIPTTFELVAESIYGVDTKT